MTTSHRRAELLSLTAGIQDLLIRGFTTYALSKAPAHFWTKPSSAGKYHPPDEHGFEGLLLHTIRVVKVASIICLSQPALDANIVLPACFLHDVCRYGDAELGAAFSLPGHPAIAANWIRGLAGNGDLGNRVWAVSAAVRSHVGRWGPVWPQTPEEWAVHYADNIAAQYWENHSA